MTASLPIASGPYLASAVLLLAAGALKTARPHPTGVALRAAGARVSDLTVRAGAVAEVLVALGALAGARPGAALLALSYAAFAVFVAVGLRGGSPVSSCGCFGEIDAAPTVPHLALNVAAAIVAVVVVADGHPPSIVDALSAEPLAVRAAFLVLVGVLAYAGYLVMTVLPRAVAAARLSETSR